MRPEFFVGFEESISKEGIIIVDLKNIQSEIDSLFLKSDEDLMAFIKFEMYEDGRIKRFEKGIRDWSFKPKSMMRLMVGIFSADEYFDSYPAIRKLRREEDLIIIPFREIKIKKYGSGIAYRQTNELINKYVVNNEYELTLEIIQQLKFANPITYQNLMQYILSEFRKGNYNVY